MMRIREWNYLFMDGCHPTPMGNRIIAEEVFKYPIDHKYFTASANETPFPDIPRLIKSEEVTIPQLVK
jgi:hypothetical protein